MKSDDPLHVAIYSAVFLNPGWCIRLSWTGWLVNNVNWFLPILEAGSLRSGASAVQLWWGSLPDGWLFLGAGEAALWSPFYQDTNPIPEGSTFITHQLTMAPPPNVITMGLVFQHLSFGRKQTFSPQDQLKLGGGRERFILKKEGGIGCWETSNSLP